MYLVNIASKGTSLRIKLKEMLNIKTKFDTFQILSRPLTISETVDSTIFNFGSLLGLSMRGKKLVELMI